MLSNNNNNTVIITIHRACCVVSPKDIDAGIMGKCVLKNTIKARNTSNYLHDVLWISSQKTYFYSIVMKHRPKYWYQFPV